jgi:vanillate O-demethylase monooxygenase subunit
MSIAVPSVTESFAKPEFPLNAWYVAAWDVEVRRELLPRTICNKHLVLYRRRDGVPVALEDACWHRLLPLSRGRIIEDEVICGYHGLRYDHDGRCTFMPSQATINPSACVRSFPTIQKHRFVWIWPGDPAMADPALVPDLHWNHDPDWAGDGGTIYVKCNYKLVVDNLMDLTHETFVHGGSIGQAAVAEVPFVTRHGEKIVEVTRWMRDVEPAAFWAAQLGKPGTVDRWQIIRFEAPCTIDIDVGVAPAGSGAPEGDRSQGISGRVLNTITPETDRTCHYFWAFARDYKLKDQALTTETRNAVAGIFHEDEIILEAQQKAIEEHPNKIFYNINIDSGAVWARRVIDRMIELEHETTRAAAE